MIRSRATVGKGSRREPGYTITQLTAAELRELYTLREAQESAALGIAVGRATRPTIPRRAALGVPVMDGVAAGTLLAQSLVRMGLRTSTRSESAPPPPKAYSALLQDFAEIGEATAVAGLHKTRPTKGAKVGEPPLQVF